MINFFKNKVLNWFRTSKHFHIHQENINNINDLVDLIDRFLDGNIRYPLEWDDFISWNHRSIHIQNACNRIGMFEKLLFSKNMSDREEYVKRLIEERNLLAKQVGITLR